jgi:hypothetical protein
MSPRTARTLLIGIAIGICLAMLWVSTASRPECHGSDVPRSCVF